MRNIELVTLVRSRIIIMDSGGVYTTSVKEEHDNENQDDIVSYRGLVAALPNRQGVIVL